VIEMLIMQDFEKLLCNSTERSYGLEAFEMLEISEKYNETNQNKHKLTKIHNKVKHIISTNN
jgi:hypothetical protein